MTDTSRMNAKNVKFTFVNIICAALALFVNIYLTSKWENLADPKLRQVRIAAIVDQIDATGGTFEDVKEKMKQDPKLITDELALPVIALMPIGKVGIDLNNGELPQWAKLAQGLLWAGDSNGLKWGRSVRGSGGICSC